MALPLRFGRESRRGDDLGAWAAHGRSPADVVEVSVREDEMTDRRMILQAKIGHCGQHAVRTGTRVDGDDSRACLDEREVTKVIGLGDVHIRRRIERTGYRQPQPVPCGQRETREHRRPVRRGRAQA
jgi:predicted DNA-binding transcriptional regulator AlpA